MGFSPLKHPLIDGRLFLTRPWAMWVELVQRLINEVQIRPVSGSAQTIDWLAGEEYALTLTADCTLTFSNPIDGGRYVLVLQQDATGGWTVTWPASVVWAGGVAPTLSAGAGAIDQVELLYLAASNQYLGTVAQAFA